MRIELRLDVLEEMEPVGDDIYVLKDEHGHVVARLGDVDNKIDLKDLDIKGTCWASLERVVLLTGEDAK